MIATAERSRKRLRNAGLAGCFTTSVTLLGCILSMVENQTVEFSRWSVGLILLILTVWIFKGSRLASAWMFIVFLTDKIFGLWIFEPSLYHILTLMLLYFFFQGARAAFALAKIKQSAILIKETTTSARISWFAAVSLAVVVLLTLSLPLKLLDSYLATRPSKYPIHYAAAKGDTLTVEQLLRAGHDINSGGPLGTPLSVAAAANRPDIIRYLIKQGADPNLPDWKGWRPIHCAVLPKRVNLAAVSALVHDGANVNGRDKHLRTPLHRAAQFGHEDALRLLLSLGADPSLTDENGWTPFDRAEKHPHIQEILSDLTK